MKGVGCNTFILHARKAILTGMSPKQNLNIPKLNYDMVYKVKKENPDLEIIINGGISKININDRTTDFHIPNTLLENSYEAINLLLNSQIGKFITLGLTWSFCFQILSEIRHLIMDLGYGFELKTTKITGLLVIIGSIFLTIILYLIGKNLF
mgnify:CR=1 FL=1